MKKIINTYNKIEEVLLVAGIIVMVVILFVQVILRFVFNNPLTWIEELARVIFIWSSWLGISLGQRHGEHIKVSMITDRLKGKTQSTALLVADVVSLVILGLFAYQGILLVEQIFAMNTVTPALAIPRWVIYSSVPFSCIVMGIRLIANIIGNVRSFGKEQMA